MKQEKKRQHFGLLTMFVLVLFAASLLNSGITTLVVHFFIRNDILQFAEDVTLGAARLMTFSLLLDIPVALMVAAAITKFPLRPVRDLINGMDALAEGNFKTRIRVGKIMRRYPAYVDVAESFNKMAQELEHTEILRADFINNFSHEFKTPIVSIAGFARLLNRSDLSREEQKQYLQAIEEESLRLSSMATNVLSLSKVENQTILTDVSVYNLSEQIRACLLLLESQWSGKDLEMDLNFEEHSIRANEELMKQVWINLLDNAVKFTPEGHRLLVRIREKETALAVEICNTGSQILPEQQKKIFDKFYQAEESHSAKGNGLGLPIAKRIVELHGGRISVRSENMQTVFTVELPKENRSLSRSL